MFTTEDDVFGVSYNAAVTRENDFFNHSNTFIFIFKSHGRCDTPHRFDARKESRGDARARFNKNNGCGCVMLVGADGSLNLGNEKSSTN